METTIKFKKSNELRVPKYHCVCGASVLKSSKFKHLYNSQHQQFLERENLRYFK